MLISHSEFELILKCKTLSVPCRCGYCKETFLITKTEAKRSILGKRRNIFCSRQCRGKSQSLQSVVSCDNCKRSFEKKQAEIRRSPKNFCSRSCSAVYNNTHKTHGTRRSKFETYLENKLKTSFPDLEIHFNKKCAIKSELDIYIPSLKLAFEINGIFHYKPIYGESKLQSIKNNDILKKKVCKDQKIDLKIVDISEMKTFKPAIAISYFNDICDVIIKKYRENQEVWLKNP